MASTNCTALPTNAQQSVLDFLNLMKVVISCLITHLHRGWSYSTLVRQSHILLKVLGKIRVLAAQGWKALNQFVSCKLSRSPCLVVFRQVLLSLSYKPRSNRQRRYFLISFLPFPCFKVVQLSPKKKLNRNSFLCRVFCWLNFAIFVYWKHLFAGKTPR